MPTMEDAGRMHPGYTRWKHVIPLPNERMMLHVGAETLENFYVVGDAWAQLLSHYIRPGSHVLDVGCGCGRTARLLTCNPHVERFTGLDVVAPYIEWCNRFFGELHGDRFAFRHLDVRSARYNPEGRLNRGCMSFPVGEDEVDLVYAASLFTHMLPDDLEHYAGEMRRVLVPGGLCLASIHDEPVEGEPFSGDEHRADYAPAHFLARMRRNGFGVVEDLGEFCGQRTWVLRREN